MLAPSMCTLAIYLDISERWPLVIAANRDEFYERPTAPPAEQKSPAGVVAGRDLEAGGTWLGLARPSGAAPPFVVAMLNRREVDGPAPRTTANQRSRGLLCMDLLGAASFDEALASLDSGDFASDYAGFNLLLAQRGRAVVVDNRGPVTQTPLEAGLSVLTNLNLNDPRCPRLAGAVTVFEEGTQGLASAPSSGVLAEVLGPLLGNHRVPSTSEDAGPFARLCVHTPSYGTRSASVIALDQKGRPHYLHADGPPCETPLRSIGIETEGP